MTMSGWSLDEMDDMIWNEFHQTNDHTVPDPGDAKESTWTGSEKHWKKLHCQNSNTLAKSTEQKISGVNNGILEGMVLGQSVSDNKAELSAQSLNVDTWVVLDDEELPTISYNCMHDDSGMRIDSQKEGVNASYYKDVRSVRHDPIQEYNEDDHVMADRDASVMNNSCHFLMNGISQPDSELDYFEGDHRSEKSNSILEYNWENIGNFEEVEKLFRNSDSSPSEAVDSSSDELLWHTASFVNTNDRRERSMQQGMESANPDSRHIGRSQNSELKVTIEGVTCDSAPSLLFDQKDDLRITHIQHRDQSSGPNIPLKESSASHMVASQGHPQNLSATLLEEKVNPNLMQTDNDELDKKVEMKFPDNDTVLNSQQPQVPYIHMGYGYPLHCLLAMPPSSSPILHGQQSQQYFSAYQMPTDALNQHQSIKQPFGVLSGPSIMTPQDKIEKLRWRQKIQDKLSAGHKQQRSFMDPSLPRSHPQEVYYEHADVKPHEGADRISETSNGEPDKLDNKSSDCGSVINNGDCSLEAKVLHQLQISMTRLNLQTRLNIRDALYRLARSAVQRHNVSDIKSNDVIGGEDFGTGLTETSCTQVDRCDGISNFETETNVADRTVAHLLFHRSATPSVGGSLTVKEASSDVIPLTIPHFPETSCSSMRNPLALHNSWLGTSPLASMQTSAPGEVVTPMPDSCIGSTNQGIPNIMQGIF